MSRSFTPDEVPWMAEAPIPDSRSDGEGNRRYQRAVRLTQFLREVRRVEQRGPMVTMGGAKLAYRRYCLANWRDYLDGKIAPLEGAKPKGGGDE